MAGTAQAGSSEPSKTKGIEAPAAAPETPTQTVRERLEALGLETEQVDALLDLLKVEGHADVNAALQNLARQLSGSPENGLTAGGQTLLTRDQALGLLQENEARALQLLKQAGLTDQEAQKLLAQLKATGPEPPAPPGPSEAAGPGPKTAATGGLSQTAAKGDTVPPVPAPPAADSPPEPRSAREKLKAQGAHPEPRPPVPESGDRPVPASVKPESGQAEGKPAGTPQPLAGPHLAAQMKGVESVKVSGGTTEGSPASVPPAGDAAGKASEGGKPVSTPPPALPRGVAESRVMEQIVNRASVRQQGSQSEIRIRLEPPSLGTVRMNISTQGETVRTVIVAENPTVKQVIENNLAQLRDSMQGQGLKVESFTVLVGGNPGQTAAQHRSPEARMPFANFGIGDTAPVPDPVAAFAPPRAGYFDRASGSISVFA